MACKNLPRAGNEWKTGTQYLVPGDFQLPVNYFTCGNYYFDGKYNCVEFPADLELYHGSAELAEANVEYPLGKDFYRPHVAGTPSAISPMNLTRDVMAGNDSVEYALSKQFNIPPVWVGDKNVAKLYSERDAVNCKKKCVMTYSLVKPAKFFLLDDDYNIWTVTHDSKIAADVKRALMFMFQLTPDSKIVKVSYNAIRISKKSRLSYADRDMTFARWLCDAYGSKYAGFAANTQIDDKGRPAFHLEFMFCNATEYLKRNLSSEADWQHSDPSGVKLMDDFLHQLSLYKTTNVDFHAGDLLEHSVWSLLFAEQLVANDAAYKPSDKWQRRIAAIAFLHDIGKMTVDPKYVTVRERDVVYYVIPEHPTMGGDYLRGVAAVPILDDDMKVVDTLDVRNLMIILGLNYDKVAKYASMIDFHWEMGKAVKNLTIASSPADYLKAAKDYIKLVGDKGYTYYYALLRVSQADVMATQPFGAGRLTPSLNVSSIFFPFVKNVPKKYRGGNVAEISFAVIEEFIKTVLNVVKTTHVKKNPFAAAPLPRMLKPAAAARPAPPPVAAAVARPAPPPVAVAAPPAAAKPPPKAKYFAPAPVYNVRPPAPVYNVRPPREPVSVDTGLTFFAPYTL